MCVRVCTFPIPDIPLADTIYKFKNLAKSNLMLTITMTISVAIFIHFYNLLLHWDSPGCFSQLLLLLHLNNSGWGKSRGIPTCVESVDPLTYLTKRVICLL